MMSDEYNKLDGFFKKKLEERKPDFNASSWEQMETLMPPQKKDKRRFLIWFFLAAFLIFFIGKWVYHPHKTTPSIEYVQAEEQVKADLKKEMFTTKEKMKNAKNKEEIEQNANREEEVEMVKRQIFKVEDTFPRNAMYSKRPMSDSSFKTELESRDLGQKREEPSLSQVVDKKLVVKEDSKINIKHSALPLLITKPMVILNQQKPKEALPNTNVFSSKSKSPLKYSIYTGLKNYERQTSSELKLGIAWEFGFEIAKALNDKWSIGTGVGLYQRKKFLNTSDDVLSISSSTAISTNVSDTLFYKPTEDAKLTYLKVPLFAEYQWNKKSSLKFGLWFSRIIGVSGDFSLTQDFLNTSLGSGAFNLEASPRKLQLEDLSHYNRTDFGLELAYQYHLTTHWSIYTGMTYGLRSVFGGDSLDTILEESMDSGVNIPTEPLPSPISTTPTNIKGRQVYLDLGIRYGF